jgi:NTE family protein
MNYIRALLIFLLLFTASSCVHRIEYLNAPKELPQITKEIEKVNVALVLGGGGAKGFAHLGVIEVLEKNNIPIDLIVGTSAGSIVGALYADNPDIKSLKKKLIQVQRKDLLDTHIFSAIYGVVRGESLRSFLDKNLKKKNIEDLQIPFVAVATSLETNQPFIFRTGPVIPAVHASSALPMVFTPVYLYGHHFIDGGAIEPVPVSIAKKFAPKLIIAVNISSSPKTTDDYSKLSTFGGYNGPAIAYHALNISYYELAKLQSQHADVNIQPDLKEISLFDDTKKTEMFNRGKVAAESKLHEIHLKLYKSGIKKIKR